MNQKDTNAPAFDRNTQGFIAQETLAAYNDGLQDGQGDLLDEMAMAALQGLLAGEAYSGPEGCISYDPEQAAQRAYNIADAMMAERQKRRAE